MVIVFPSVKRRRPDEGRVNGAVTDDALSHADAQLVKQVAGLDSAIGGEDPVSGGADPTSGGACPTSGHANSSDDESCDPLHSKRRKYDGSCIKFPANMTLATPEASSSSYSYTKDALIVVGHVLYRISNLSKKAKKAFAVALGCKFGKQERPNVARRACAMLLQMPERKVQEFMQSLNIARGPSFLDAAAEIACELISTEAQPPVNNSVEDQERQALLNIIRTGLAACVEGHSDCQFIRQLSRLQLAGAPVGDRYHSRDFLKSLEVLGSECVRTTLAMQLRRRLRGLQIRSLFGLIFDGVNPVGGLFSTHDTLLLIGIRFVDPRTGKLSSRLLAAPSCGLKKSGHDVSFLVKEAIRDKPLNLNTWRLTQRLIALGGDGQVTKGGPDAQHESTGACELLWASIHEPSSLTATYWDTYHLKEAAIKLSLKHVCADEVLSMYKLMNSLFGVGDGRIIARNVAAIIGERAHKPPAPCHTRQGTDALRNAEDLIKNYPLYHASMRVRLEQSHQDPETGKSKGAQSVSSLVDSCRRFSGVDFVVFLSGFYDVQKHVQRFDLIGQLDGGEAPMVHKEKLRVISEFSAFPEAVDLLRAWAHVTVHLMGYHVSERDLKNMWGALRYHPMARCLPTACKVLPSILVKRSFQGCILQCRIRCPETAKADTHMLVAARCQCPTKRTPFGSCARVRMPAGVVRMPAGEVRTLLVPEWVARGHIQPRSRRVPGGYWQDIPPRMQLLAKEESTPLWARGMRRYTSNGPCKCVLPILTLDTFLDVDAALLQIKSYAQSVHKSVGAFMGRRGYNTTTLALMQAASVAWDWAFLLFNEPKEEHVRAFVRVHVAFSYHFRNIERPPLSYVNWPWPPVNEVALQYVHLLKRIRNKEKKSHCFSSTTKADVRRIAFRSRRETLLARNSGWSERIWWMVFDFLAEGPAPTRPGGPDPSGGPGPGSDRGALFTVSSKSLCLPGWSEALKPHAIQRAESYTLSRPILKRKHVVALATGPLRNSLVVICKLHREADATAIHAAIDCDPTLHAPAEVSNGFVEHCWNAGVVAHMSRLQAPEEAPCERWGSLMHSNFSADQKHPPERHACRLFLKEAGCKFVGGRQDEVFVHAVADIMMREQRKFGPFTTTAKKCVERNLAIPLSLPLQRLRQEHAQKSLLLHQNLKHVDLEYHRHMDRDAEHRQAYRGAALAPREQTALKKSLYEGGVADGSKCLMQEELPRWKTHGASSKQKADARSHHRDLLQEWLTSKKGKEWEAQREKMFPRAEAE